MATPGEVAPTWRRGKRRSKNLRPTAGPCKKKFVEKPKEFKPMKEKIAYLESEIRIETQS
jgi:hypothetical protein